MFKSPLPKCNFATGRECGTGMATTGCASPGSITLASMRQLYALHPLKPHSCKMGSLVFFVFLPALHPLKPHPCKMGSLTCNKQRSPLSSPPLCGHGDLEIISVKELADGFLHFSFGVPSNVSTSSKVDELSSSCSEHLAGKLSVPRRLPSKFSKKSPIPVAAVRQRKRQGENTTKQGLADDTSSNGKEPVTSSLRPKSCFVKRSPIPMRRSVQSLQSEIASDEANVQYNSQPMPQRTQIGSLKVGISKRPPSAFVRKSPVSQTARNPVKSLLPSANPDTLSDKAGDTAVRSHRKSVMAEVSRPKSVFSRRSPIVRAHKLPHKISINKTLQKGHKNSSDVDSASGISSATSESSSQKYVDLQKCKLAELKNLAKTKGLKGYSKLKKGELLDLLQNLDS